MTDVRTRFLEANAVNAIGNCMWETDLVTYALQAFQDLVGRQYRLANHMDVVPELPTFNEYVAVGNGTGLWATNGSVYLLERPSMPVNDLTWDDHVCALYQGNLIYAPAASIPANVAALANSTATQS